VKVAEELTLDDGGISADHLQVALVVVLGESQLVVLATQVTFIHARRHVTHYIDLGTESQLFQFI